MLESELALVFIDSFDFFTYKKKELFFNLLNKEENALNYNKILTLKPDLLKFLKEEEIEILFNQIVAKEYTKVEEQLKDLNITAITKVSKQFPKSLKNIDTPPFVLYCKGNLELLNKEGFAIVGTRHITNYGKMATEKFAKGLVEAGFTIVSGLAEGVDTIAHTTTLQQNGKTIAVLAGGLNEIYPKNNTNLAKSIVENNGLLVSEQRPYKKPDSYMFPIRNRIIAALSKGVLITEAQEKSGVIHTKNYALEYGKDVFSVPGSIFSVASAGANRIIVNSQAKAVIEVQDILDEYNINLKVEKRKVENFSIEEDLIINALKSGEKTFQELILITKFEAKTLNSLLTTLLIRGLIKKLAGNVYYLI